MYKSIRNLLSNISSNEEIVKLTEDLEESFKDNYIEYVDNEFYEEDDEEFVNISKEDGASLYADTVLETYLTLIDNMLKLDLSTKTISEITRLSEDTINEIKEALEETMEIYSDDKDVYYTLKMNIHLYKKNPNKELKQEIASEIARRCKLKQISIEDTGELVMELFDMDDDLSNKEINNEN